MFALEMKKTGIAAGEGFFPEGSLKLFSALGMKATGRKRVKSKRKPREVLMPTHEGTVRAAWGLSAGKS